MQKYYRSLKQLADAKAGQELPGWSFIVMLIIGLFVIVFLVWLAVKSGRAGVDQIRGLG